MSAGNAGLGAHCSDNPRAKAFAADQSRLVDHLDLAGSPGLVEPGFERPVKPEDCKPAFARDGRHPV